MATSPYGTLPAAPLVAQSQVEHKVGISQRQKGNTGSSFRPVAVVTPRSIAPRSGVRLRNPRLRLASRCDMLSIPSHAGIWTCSPIVVVGDVSLLRLCRSAEAAAADLPSNGNSGVVNDGDKLQMRENPRRLFVRDPLPGTEPVSYSQGSPPAQRAPQSGSEAPQSADGNAANAGQNGEARMHDRAYGDGRAQAHRESRSRRPLSDAEVGRAAACTCFLPWNATSVGSWTSSCT